MTAKPPANLSNNLEVRHEKAKDLLLDAKNPRLVEHEFSTFSDQDRILKVLWQEMAVDELALSIATNGFFQNEPLFAEEESKRLVVIEGNRRLAAVKLLLDESLREKIGAVGIPKISNKRQQELAELPVVRCTRADIWQYIGFKHVNGPQEWQSYSKAQYIAKVHNELRIPLDKIAEQIGDKHSTVKRLYRALMVIEQAEKEGIFQRSERYKKKFAFSHLYTGLDYQGIPQFIGISQNKGFQPNPIPKQYLSHLEQLLEWLYGNKQKDKPPIIKTQNPDLRDLEEVLRTKDGISALRKGYALKVALDISKGDVQLFRESMVSAKHSLEEAKGKLVRGYNGEADLLETAMAIVDLANSILEEMKSKRSKKN